MKLSALLSVLLLLLAIEKAYPSRQCNLVNTAMQGIVPCAMTWWMSTDLSKNVTFSPNATRIITNSLYNFGVTPDQVNDVFRDVGFPDANASNILSKFIESQFVLEPYLIYAAADIIAGFNLTEDDLAKLNLPALLSDHGNLRTLYKNYFSTSCAVDPLDSFFTCIDNWMTKNCDAEEDRPDAVLSLMNSLKGSYCTDDKSWKPSVKKSLDDSLGTVVTPVMRGLGAERDPASPFVFNNPSDWRIANYNLTRRMSDALMSNCFYFISDEFSSTKLQAYMSSTVGVGVDFERIADLSFRFAACSLDVFKEHFGLGEEIQKSLDNFKELYPDIGNKLEEMKKPYFGSQRKTTAVYGSSHWMPYKMIRDEMCATEGWQTYLSNSHYTLKARTEAACRSNETNNCISSKAREISLKFHKEGVEYKSSERGDSPVKTLTTADGDQVSEKGKVLLDTSGDAVRIIDRGTGTVFMIIKYNERYMFAVRQASRLFDDSTGFLITGCPNPVSYDAMDLYSYSIWYSRCSDSCNDLYDLPTNRVYELWSNCMVDCKKTKDITVVKGMTKAVEMLTDIEKKDEEMSALETDESPLTTTAKSTTPTTPVDTTGESCVTVISGSKAGGSDEKPKVISIKTSTQQLIVLLIKNHK